MTAAGLVALLGASGPSAGGAAPGTSAAVAAMPEGLSAPIVRVGSGLSAPSQPSARSGQAAPDWRTAVPATAKRAVVAQAAAKVRAKSVTITTMTVEDGAPKVETRTLAGHAALAAVTRAANDSGVLAVALDSPVYASAAGPDVLRPNQWALNTLAYETAVARHDAAGVTVAVIDSGVQASHPDLAGVVLPGIDYVTAGGDGSADGNGHGTHVAGIIAAVANNSIGIAGLAKGAKILPVRVLDNAGSGYSSSITKGIIYAADRGASVISMSLGGTAADATQQTAITYARSKGAIVIAAAGNNRATGNQVNYPAAYAGVLAVAASDSKNLSASFSSTGSHVSLTAPGVDILSTYKGSTYASLSGTSMATPYVAAEAALLKSAKPSLSVDQLSAAMINTAKDLGTPGRDNQFGYGLINPVAALCEVGYCGAAGPPTTTPAPTPTATPTLSPTVAPKPTPTPSATPSATPTATPTPTVPPISTPKPSPTPSLTPTTVPKPTATPTPVAKTNSSFAFSALPTGAVYGSASTVIGTLSSAGRPVAGAVVKVCTRTTALPAYTCTPYVTGSTGGFTASLRLAASGFVKFTYDGSATVNPVATGDSPYRLTSAMTVTAGTGSLKAVVSPSLGQSFLIEQRSGSQWTIIARGALPNAGATAVTTVTVTKLVTGSYRFSVLGNATVTDTISSAVNVVAANK